MDSTMQYQGPSPLYFKIPADFVGGQVYGATNNNVDSGAARVIDSIELGDSNGCKIYCKYRNLPVLSTKATQQGVFFFTFPLPLLHSTKVLNFYLLVSQQQK